MSDRLFAIAPQLIYHISQLFLYFFVDTTHNICYINIVVKSLSHLYKTNRITTYIFSNQIVKRQALEPVFYVTISVCYLHQFALSKLCQVIKKPKSCSKIIPAQLLGI